MVLVDSSVYIRFQRLGIDPIGALTERYSRRQLAVCDLVRCEVLRGMVSTAAQRDLRDFFDLLPHVEMDRSAWRLTEQLAWKLDRAGKVLPIADLIIAVCALRAGAEMLTDDDHFRHIPNLLLAEW